MNLDALTIDTFERVNRTPDPAESRATQRFPLQLKVAVVYHQHEDVATRPTYHGRTCDVSLHGLSVVVEHNIFTPRDITVLLALPPVKVGAAQEIVEATATMAYTVLSSQHDAFRIGLVLKSFKRDGAKRLQAVLAERFEYARLESGSAVH